MNKAAKRERGLRLSNGPAFLRTVLVAIKVAAVLPTFAAVAATCLRRVLVLSMLTAPAVAKAAIARPILLVREPVAFFALRVAMFRTSDKMG